MSILQYIVAFAQFFRHLGTAILILIGKAIPILPARLASQLIKGLHAYGYIGAFFIGLFGNSIPFVPIPYYVPIFFLATVLNPLLLGIAVGVGASIGKCVSYFVGRGGAKILSKEKQRDLEYFSRLFGKYGMVAIFLFAALPLPDDIIMVPMGVAKYNFTKFYTALLSGKLILGITISYLAAYSIKVFNIVSRGNEIIIAVLSILLMFGFLYIIFKIDWVEAADYTEKHGILAYFRLLVSRALSKKANECKNEDDR